jgi:predicted nucleic acid-binding protein
MTFDTCFLIDFEREQRRRKPGPAHAFLRPFSEDTPMHLSTVALGEFVEGLRDPESSQSRLFFSLFHLLPIDRPVALHYGRISRQLRAAGTPLGTNDLWIAVTALEHGLPLVTRNTGHFDRVPGLQIITY